MCLCWKVNRVLVQRSAKKIPLKTNQLPEIWGFLTTRELFYSHTKSFLSSRLPSEIRTPNTFHIHWWHSLTLYTYKYLSGEWDKQTYCENNGKGGKKQLKSSEMQKKLKWSIKVIGGVFLSKLCPLMLGKIDICWYAATNPCSFH